MTTYRSFTVAADEAQLVARLVMAEEVASAAEAVRDRARARLARWSERQAARIADGTIKVQTDVTSRQEKAS